MIVWLGWPGWPGPRLGLARAMGQLQFFWPKVRPRLGPALATTRAEAGPWADKN